MRTTMREELAWAAGLFDGEGSSVITRDAKANRTGVRMVVSQVDREVLDRFQGAVLGLGRVVGPYTSINRTSRPLHQWIVTDCSGVQAVAAMLWPFLGTIKREQAKLMLLGMKWPGGPRVTHCPQQHEYTAANTYSYRTKAGHLLRQCKTCARERRQAKRDAARAA